MKSILKFLIFSNLWVALCVLGLSLSSELLLVSDNFKVSQFVFCSTIFIYNFQRIIRLNNGDAHVRKAWFLKNKLVIYLFMLVSILFSVYYFLQFQNSTKLAIILIGVLSFFYPYVLRNIPYLKIFIISLVWTISTMLLLVIENNLSITKDISLHLCCRFLFVFAITIPFDIRDLKYDFKKLRTIPLYFGILKSKLIAVLALVFCVLIAVLQYFNNSLIWSNLLALILLYFTASIFILNSDKDKSDGYFSFWGESLSVLVYLFLVIMVLIF